MIFWINQTNYFELCVSKLYNTNPDLIRSIIKILTFCILWSKDLLVILRNQSDTSSEVQVNRVGNLNILNLYFRDLIIINKTWVNQMETNENPSQPAGIHLTLRSYKHFEHYFEEGHWFGMLTSHAEHMTKELIFRTLCRSSFDRYLFHSIYVLLTSIFWLF